MEGAAEGRWTVGGDHEAAVAAVMLMSLAPATPGEAGDMKGVISCAV
jgi:hypothetical protein